MKKFTFLFIFTFVYSLIWAQCNTTADYTYTYTGCSTIQFTDASTASANYNLVKWEWDYGDGTTASGQTVTHTFTPGITVQVQLIVTADSSGVTCTDTVVKTIVVHALPTVYVASDPNPTCVTVPAHFFGSSGQKIRSWQWDFGDGKFDTLQNPFHLYPDTGSYQVVLHVVDTNGCANQNDPSYVQVVNPAPTLDFSWDINPAAVTDNLQFTATAQGNVTSWHWDFGDGDTANIQNPTHQYSDTGQYHVTLSIVVDGLCTNALTKTVSIVPLPEPDFSVSPVCLNDTTFFTDQSTTPSGTTIDTWKWYFGDGDSLIIHAPDQPDAKHIYTNQTTYEVTLLTVNSAGYQRSLRKSVEVKKKPLANFRVNDTCFGNPSQFTDLSQDNGGSVINQWRWMFSDPGSGVNDTSSLQNPQHIFSVPDTFAVRLIISNNDGCRDTAVHSVIMDSLPAVDFSQSKDSLCLGEQVQFTGFGNNIVLWYWDFGNGDTSTFQNPVYVFPKPGLYTVTLSVTNLKGCVNSISHNIYVIALPHSDFTFSSSCIGDSTYFTDRSSDSVGYIAQWHWSFGDTTSSTDTSVVQNPAHYYEGITSYKVQLITTNNFGCRDTTYKYLNVYDRPKPGFTYIQSCNPASEIQFYDTSHMGNSKAPIASYLWNFYQNDTSHQQNPAYKFFTYDTNYLVTLRVTDTNGCSNIDSTVVHLRDSLRIDFTVPKTCFTQPAHFKATYLPGTDSIARYTWNFNDGSPQFTTYLDTVSHVFPHPGVYTVELSAIDTNGCFTTVSHEAVVDSLPIPNFGFVTPACDQPTYFTDSSQGGGNFIRSWLWNFDDPAAGPDSISNSRNPSHFYGPMEGTYSVKLIVTNFNGCIDSITKPVVRPSCLTARYETSPGRNCARNDLYFKDKSVLHSSHGSITRWDWDFGDGNTQSYQSFTDSIAHTYAGGGTYRATLTVTAQVNGISFSVPYDSVIVVNPTPSASFTSDNLCLGGETAFTDQSMGNGSPVTGWLWHFNDPASGVDTSVLQNPLHKFSGIGQYNVQLTVSNTFGCRDTLSQNIDIAASPKADFSVGKACSGQPVQFSDSSKTFGTNLVSWQWAFHDPYASQDSAFVQNPVHVYDSAGAFLVQLVVTDSHYCRDTASKPVDIHETPKADFDILYNYRGVTGQVLMQNKTVGATSYLWNFGDGNTSTEENPVNRYQSGDVYNIVLIATSQFQCTDTATKVYDLTLGLYVPNSFAPASDVPGTNVFQPKGIHLKEYHIQVFSAWGTLLWESSKLTEDGEPAEGWDGTYKGQPMPAGNYIWRIKARFIDNSYWGGSNNGDGNTKPYGTVTLIR